MHWLQISPVLENITWSSPVQYLQFLSAFIALPREVMNEWKNHTWSSHALAAVSPRETKHAGALSWKLLHSFIHMFTKL